MPSHTDAPLANLLWLLPVPDGARAGCFGLTDTPVTAALALHLPGLRTDPPYPDASLDFLAGVSEGPLSNREVVEAARTLAPGGTVVLFGPASRRFAEAAHLRRDARSAGFTDVRIYRFAGSTDHPMDVVPDSIEALTAHTRTVIRERLRSLIRRVAIRAGRLPREFHGLIVVGTRA